MGSPVPSTVDVLLTICSSELFVYILLLLIHSPTMQVDNNFFLSTTPIEQFESTFLVSTFPRANRVDVLQTREDIKTQLSK